MIWLASLKILALRHVNIRYRLVKFHKSININLTYWKLYAIFVTYLGELYKLPSMGLCFRLGRWATIVLLLNVPLS